MGAAPLALPREAGAGGIMMGTPTQPFRAGLTFSGQPSGPRWDLGRSPGPFRERKTYFSGYKAQQNILCRRCFQSLLEEADLGGA
jgi:hypothetical protein